MALHLITGGSGFLGNLIARRLLEAGEQVKVLDIWKDPTFPIEIEFIKSDIRDFDKVMHAMKGVEYVHHNVALVPLTKSGKDFWSVNVEGARIAAESAKKSGVKNFVHMSSSAIYGAPTELPITLKTSYNPIEVYGRGKLEGEISVSKVLRDSNTNLVIIRPRTIIGPGRLGIFQVLFKWIEENRNVYTIGNGKNLFQFVHAIDLMNAYMLAFSTDHPGTFNIGTDNFGTLREALEHLILHARSESKVVSLPRKSSILALTLADKLRISPLAPWHYLTYDKPFYFELTEIKNLGWRPKYSNDAMFREAYDIYKSGQKIGSDSSSPHRKQISEGILKLIKKLS